MTKNQKSRLVEVINLNIEEANRLFKTKEQSDAYIIGFLLGVLRVVREELEKILNEAIKKQIETESNEITIKVQERV